MEVKFTNTQDIECAIRTILSFIGEDPCREGLKGTPDRIIRMWREIFRGYDLSQVPKITVFPNGVDGLSCDSVIADSGGFYSMCEHHMMGSIGLLIYPIRKVRYWAYRKLVVSLIIVQHGYRYKSDWQRILL